MTLPGVPSFSSSLTEMLFQGLKNQPEGYAPRTHHKTTDGQPKYINRLINTRSPYLLQHAHNPVNWYPWGQEALDLAQSLDRPILLSVGYSTCHWCHVMERESFEDVEIAEYINRNYVAIKVDREERPDLDAVYMTAVQLATGSGGWPMTVFLTPDKAPFFAGTYFPARDGDRGARIGFLTLLNRINDAWQTDRDQLLSGANRLLNALKTANKPKVFDNLPNKQALIEAAKFLAKGFDPIWGGFHGAPKFPRTSTYEFLLRYARRTGDEQARHIVRVSLEKMSAGGLYDHIGGGFARYSTDKEWKVPHFEKMLYDNAQLSILLTEALQSQIGPHLKQPLRDTLNYIIREMTNERGGFYSATDADSEGVEGKFFTWTREEIISALGPFGETFCKFYGVTQEGQLDGRSVLFVEQPVDEFSQANQLKAETLQLNLSQARKTLYNIRKSRAAPFLDDKVLTEWNVLMISAMARASFVLDNPDFLQAAEGAANFLLDNLRNSDGHLHRAWRNGHVSGQPILEDYIFSLTAMLDLFEASANPKWLALGQELAKLSVDLFWDAEDGGFYSTSRLSETLLVRDKPYYDGAIPSGNSMAALAFLRLATLTENSQYQEVAARTLLASAQLLVNGAVQNPKMAQALDWSLDRPLQIAVLTTHHDDGKHLTSVLRETFLPNAVKVIVSEEQRPDLESFIPWLENKMAIDQKATAFVCFEGTCKRPTHDPSELKLQLRPEIPFDASPLVIKQR